MLQEFRFGIRLDGVAQRGVERPSALELVIPGEWPPIALVGRAKARIGRFVDVEEHVHVEVHPLDLVPLVGAHPFGREMGRRFVAGVHDQQLGLLDGRVTLEVTSDQLPVPRPAVLGVARRVDAHKPTAGLDVALQGDLARLTQYVLGRAQEQDDVEPGEVLFGENSRIFGRLDRESVLGAQLAQRFSARLDRIVTKARGFGKHEQPGLGAACRNAYENQGSEQEAGHGQASGRIWGEDTDQRPDGQRARCDFGDRALAETRGRGPKSLLDPFGRTLHPLVSSARRLTTGARSSSVRGDHKCPVIERGGAHSRRDALFRGAQRSATGQFVKLNVIVEL